MTTRITRLLTVALCGGALVAAPLVAAPQAAAACPAGTVLDGRTGICWDATSTGTNVITGTGGVCLPGRIGLCMAGLQNSTLPGAALKPPVAVGPNRVSPSGSWP